MAEVPRLTSDVQRRNPLLECGVPVGQLNIKIQGSIRPFETVSFYCNRPKLHSGECEFIGAELIVRRRRRD